MTDNDIIEALECCGNQMYSCNDKQCKAKTIGDAIDLINRQQAEIEILKGWERLLKAESHAPIIKKAKAEAVKEFAERLKRDCPDKLLVMHFDAIDNLVKEMVGEDK